MEARCLETSFEAKLRLNGFEVQGKLPKEKGKSSMIKHVCMYNVCIHTFIHILSLFLLPYVILYHIMCVFDAHIYILEPEQQFTPQETSEKLLGRSLAYLIQEMPGSLVVLPKGDGCKLHYQEDRFGFRPFHFPGATHFWYLL